MVYLVTSGSHWWDPVYAVKTRLVGLVNKGAGQVWGLRLGASEQVYTEAWTASGQTGSIPSIQE